MHIAVICSFFLVLQNRHVPKDVHIAVILYPNITKTRWKKPNKDSSY